MKIKNVLLMGLSFVLVAVIAIGGTVAYLIDTDSDVNVMTMGNVSIAQHEYERVVNENGTFATKTIDNTTSYVLQDFTQGKPILPSAIDTTTWEGWGYDSTTVRMTQVDSYGGMQVFFAESNAQDKFVTVENTGKTDAYIRTLVAIECGDGDANLVGSSFHFTWTNNRIGIIEIDGNKYYLTEYVYKGGQLSDGSWRHGKGILPAGDTSYPNLSQVYLHSRATNEDCEALDGNDNGTLDILVFSQAVQADGFADATTALDAAFGDITTTNHPWAGEGNEPVIPAVASNADELAKAVEAAEAGDEIILTEDVTLSETLSVPAGVTLSLDGVKINGTVKALGDLTIKGDAYIKTLSAVDGGIITVEDLELNNFSFGSKNTASSEYTINGDKITANYGFFQYGTFDLNADFETGYMYYSYGSDITVYGTFHSQGKGDGLDYVRGKLTIAAGGKSIHDKTLWVGQPEGWGAMSATLIVEDGGYIQANSLSVYSGSTLQIDASDMQAGEVTSVVCNKITNTGTVEAINNTSLTASVENNKIVLAQN